MLYMYILIVHVEIMHVKLIWVELSPESSVVNYGFINFMPLILCHLWIILLLAGWLINSKTHRIEGNFRGTKYSWFSWLKVWPRIFYHKWSDLAYLYQQCKLSNHENITYEKCLNIAEPRIFCLPKNTVDRNAKYPMVYEILKLSNKVMTTLWRLNSTQNRL